MPRPKPQEPTVRVEFACPTASYAAVLALAEAHGQSISATVAGLVGEAVKKPSPKPSVGEKPQSVVVQAPTVSEKVQGAPAVGGSVGEKPQLGDHQVLHNRAKATHTRCAVCGERPGG